VIFVCALRARLCAGGERVLYGVGVGWVCLFGAVVCAGIVAAVGVIVSFVLGGAGGPV
jgi:hypothetical protein